MTDYYVDQASVGGDGTLSTPWSLADFGLTANQITVGGGGNTVYILDAITSQIPATSFAKGVDGNHTIYRGDYPGRECTVTVTGDVSVLSMAARNYFDITGFTFNATGGSAAYAAIKLQTPTISVYIYNNVFNSSRGVYLDRSDGNRIYNNTFTCTHDVAATYGIRVANSDDNLIYGNTVTGSTSQTEAYTASGIILNDATSTGNKIYRNRIYNLYGDGISLVKANSNFVVGNIVGPKTLDSIALEDSDSNSVYNNTVIQDNYFTAQDSPAMKIGDNFGAGNPSDSNIVKNNIFYGDGNYVGVYGQSGYPMGQNNVIDYNYYWSPSASTSYTISFFDGVAGPSNQTFAQFQAEGYETAGDEADALLDSEYKPTVDSPVYQAGGATRHNERDYNDRPFHIPPTIGAYEMTSGFPAQTRTARS